MTYEEPEFIGEQKFVFLTKDTVKADEIGQFVVI